MSNVEGTTVFEWTPEYSVNIPEIDREHRVLFGTVESLLQAMRAGEGKQRLGALLAEMIRYTAQHFTREEAFMAAAGFPELQAHRSQHAELSSVVLAFQQRFDRGETTMTIEVMQFLIFWLRRHTTGSDRRFGQFLEAARDRRNAAGNSTRL